MEHFTSHWIWVCSLIEEEKRAWISLLAQAPWHVKWTLFFFLLKVHCPSFQYLKPFPIFEFSTLEMLGKNWPYLPPEKWKGQILVFPTYAAIAMFKSWSTLAQWSHKVEGIIRNSPVYLGLRGRRMIKFLGVAVPEVWLRGLVMV
jgi:hypothetical protein